MPGEAGGAGDPYYSGPWSKSGTIMNRKGTNYVIMHARTSLLIAGN